MFLGLLGLRLFRLLPIGGALIFGLAVAVLIMRLQGPAGHGPSASAPLSALANEAIDAHKAPPVAPKKASADRIQDQKAAQPKLTSVVVDEGDTLIDILTRSGADRGEAADALAALRKVFDPRTLKVGQQIALLFGPVDAQTGARPLQSVTFMPEPGRHVATARGADGFSATANRLPEVHDFAHYAGTIKSSLFESATDQGVPPQVLAAMIRAFSYDVDFQRDLQPGDGFEMMYQRTLDTEGDVLRAGDIVYAELVLSGRHLPIYRYVDASGFADFYNARGESVRKALLRTPVDGAHITSGYGMRLHPILGYTTMHKGVDFGAPTGTNVMAAGDGIVTAAGPSGNYGIYLRIQHNKQYATAYAHMSRIAPGIHVGSHVKQGEVIGHVGMTGLATGPHLYYEVLVDGHQVNPVGVRFKSGSVLAGRDLARFKSMVAAVEARLTATPLTRQLALAPADARDN